MAGECSFKKSYLHDRVDYMLHLNLKIVKYLHRETKV